MYWESLLHSARKRIVQTLLIGAGDYGLSFVFQAQRTPGLRVCAIHDRSIERGLAAFRHAGLPGEAIAICESLGAAQAVLQAGRVFVTPDPLLPMQLPIDLVVEATGSPEAAACHAEAALQHGKHVAMVTRRRILSSDRSYLAEPGAQA